MLTKEERVKRNGLRKIANDNYSEALEEIKSLPKYSRAEAERQAFVRWHTEYWYMTNKALEEDRKEREKELLEKQAPQTAKLREEAAKQREIERAEYRKELIRIRDIRLKHPLQFTDKSEFTGGVFKNALICCASILLNIITLGLAYPFIFCWTQRWRAEHTYINGCKLTFNGKAGQFFGKYIVWMLLSVITLGIFYIVKGCVLIEDWVVKHTHFEGCEPEEGEENTSEFTGKWYQIFGVSLLTGFVSIITLSLGSYWAHCYKTKWLYSHRTIDTYDLCFDGTAFDYFCKSFVWSCLTVITLGVYGIWYLTKLIRWETEHTHIA